MYNENFYKTVNELVTLASGGTITGVVDYASFVDAGAKLSNLNFVNFANSFIAAFMNKIALTINTARSYVGRYKDLVRGQINMGNTIEMIMNHFYDTQAAVFVELPEGQTIDQYIVQHPEATVKYFTKYNAYDISRTIQYEQIRQAFTSPATMNNFMSGVMMYILNSNEHARESARLGMVADLISRLTTATAATTAEDSAQRYKVLSLYNSIAGTQLTPDNCLYNEEFNKFLVTQIAKVQEKLSMPSTSYNKESLKTFSRPEDTHLFISSLLAKNTDTYIYLSNINPQYLPLRNYIDVPYWQDEKNPLTITYDSDGEGTSVTTPPVVAMICDKYAIGEWVDQEQLEVTPYNARGQYWNYYLHVKTRYIRNDSANAVVFTLE